MIGHMACIIHNSWLPRTISADRSPECMQANESLEMQRRKRPRLQQPRTMEMKNQFASRCRPLAFSDRLGSRIPRELLGSENAASSPVRQSELNFHLDRSGHPIIVAPIASALLASTSATQFRGNQENQRQNFLRSSSRK